MTKQSSSPNTLQSSIAEIVSSLLTRELRKFDHRTCHRLLETQPLDPKPTSKKLASFPQNGFLSDLRASSASSVKNAPPRTLDAPEASPARDTVEPVPPELPPAPVRLFLVDPHASPNS